jgi:hypothetical protein
MVTRRVSTKGRESRSRWSCGLSVARLHVERRAEALARRSGPPVRGQREPRHDQRSALLIQVPYPLGPSRATPRWRARPRCEL